MSSTSFRSISTFLVILVFYLLRIQILKAQNYTIRAFTMSDGLPHNSVRDIVKDRSGYLWLSTFDGLSRFDGYEFKNYHHIPGDSTTLPYFSAGKIVLDSKNDLWVLTDNGKIARYNRRTNNFSTVRRINGESIGTYSSMCSDHLGRVWIFHDSVFYMYTPDNGIFTKFRGVFNDTQRSIPKDFIYDLDFENKNTFWITGSLALRFVIDEKAGTVNLTRVCPVMIPVLPRSKIVTNWEHAIWYKIYFDKTGRKWLFSNTGLFYLDEIPGTFREFKGTLPLKDFERKNILCWGDATGGLNILRPESDSLIKVPEGTVQFLKFICQAGNDVLWYSNTSFSGYSLGLSELIFTPGYFRKFTDPGNDGEVPAVFSVCVDKYKNLWMGIRGRQYITVLSPAGKLTRKYTPASSSPGVYGPVRSIKRTENGLWIGYFINLLLFYDYKSEKFIQYNPGRYLYRALEVRSDHKLYIGNSELLIYDPITGKLQLLYDSIPGGGNFRFHLGKDSILWSGTPYGVVLSYNPGQNIVRKFQTINTDNNIEDVCPGDSNNIWLASLGGGLIRFNTGSGLSRVYTTSDGLANNTVYCILRDREGYLWLSTDDGISRFDPVTGIFKNFGLPEGLDIKEFNSGASFIDADGKFWFGGMGGVVCFSPDSINRSETAHAENMMILTSLSVSGKPKVLPTDLNSSDTIILNKGENNFHLTYAVSDFANSEKTIYRYLLTGHDKEWVITEHTNRNINYANLAPGLFRLTIQATDRTGQWNVRRVIQIKLLPWFYQTKVFIGLVCLIAFGIFHLIISLYLRNFRIKTSQVLDNLRLQSLRGQMNPHFIFNSLNSINYFISNNDKLSANRYIADFARLIRSILSNMEKEYVSFTGEMQSIRDYLEIEHLRFGDKFDYEIDTSGLPHSERSEVFPGLIQPFVENAIWHGVRALEERKAFIRISFSAVDTKKIRCIIDDDGIGRRLSGELKGNLLPHKSRGISIVSERLQIISKLIKTDFTLSITDLFPDRKETGTRVEIFLPCRPIS